jgi:hypothetical protein
MHWFMHARRGVLLFTSRFDSPIAAAPHDIRRKISMHVRNAAPVMQTHGPAHDRPEMIIRIPSVARQKMPLSHCSLSQQRRGAGSPFN